jgi:putative ABC transport system permease protein
MFLNALLIALREIRRNLTRAFLTVLGIVIGVAAVVTMITLGRGATAAVREQVSNLGSNLLVMRPGMGYGGRTPLAGVPNFTIRDADALREQVASVVAVAPVSQGAFSTIYLQNARTTNVTGTIPAWFEIGKWTITEGRLLDEKDLRTGNAVCVIGQTVRKELFGDENPIGAKIRIKKSSVEVVGLLKTKGQTGFGQDQDDVIVVPLTTMERRLSGRTSAQTINQIMLSGAEGTSSDLLIAEISAIMRERRNLVKNEDNNFTVFDTRMIAETLSSSTKVMTSLLGAVAGVSLLVGGIGIMNIMLVSVTERTREIGIRLAIGARPREVLLQFLVEAITLSSLGGLIGIALAFGFCHSLSKLIEVPFLFDPVINGIAFFFSAGVGILFGFMPARRAASLDPIEALRHE